MKFFTHDPLSIDNLKKIRDDNKYNRLAFEE